MTLVLSTSFNAGMEIDMTRRPTAADVARRAEVSRAAVSLVLSGQAKQARLSDLTQERVLKAAKDLNYRPNAAGRSLVRGRTETIGLVIRDLALLDVDPYLQPLLNGILQRSGCEGYRLLVESARSAANDDPFGELMDSGRIDGMLVQNPNYGDKSLRRLIRSGRPVVLLGSQGLKEEFSVTIDDQQIGLIATQHLISIGRRRIAHIGYTGPGIYAVDRRFDGYRRALRHARLRFEPELVTHASFSMESGYRAMARLFAAGARPDAVFASSDAVALGAVAAVQDAGLRIPQDIAVASIDDIAAARFCRPSLTTVTSEPDACGRLAADILIDLMSGRSPKVRKQVVATKLIVRGSTDEHYKDSALLLDPPASL